MLWICISLLIVLAIGVGAVLIYRNNRRKIEKIVSDVKDL